MRRFDPDKLERLGRYEAHLDRKLERMLTMLLRLKELRCAAVRADPFGKSQAGCAGPCQGCMWACDARRFATVEMFSGLPPVEIVRDKSVPQEPNDEPNHFRRLRAALYWSGRK